jgi:hypothetical protein
VLLSGATDPRNRDRHLQERSQPVGYLPVPLGSGVLIAQRRRVGLLPKAVHQFRESRPGDRRPGRARTAQVVEVCFDSKQVPKRHRGLGRDRLRDSERVVMVLHFKVSSATTWVCPLVNGSGAMGVAFLLSRPASPAQADMS